MILVPFPHMALNAKDVPGANYAMFSSWDSIEETTSVDSIIARIFANAVTAPGGRLSTVILNAHGKPGKIFLGAGITINDVTKFSILKGVVGQIWIVACNVARTRITGNKADGQLFCSRLAQESGAFVLAGNCMQQSFPFLPYGYIDDFEGEYFFWDPTGRCLFSFYNTPTWMTVADIINAKRM